MMDKHNYQVFWTYTAQQDVKRIMAYISADSEVQAKKVYTAIKQRAGHLKQLPLQGGIVPALQYFSILTYRELIEPPWRIIYKVENRTVWVLAVLDSRRSIEDILLERLLEG